jgi:phosphatidate cytidylyltransferase
MVDDRDERPDEAEDDTSSDASLNETGNEPTWTGEATGGVRIIGAHEAGDPEGTGDARPVVRVRGGAEPPSYGEGQVWADDDADADADVTIPPVNADESYELPHYSDPPTGQVPKVVIGDHEPPPEGWAGVGGQPRWRDQDHDNPEGHDFADLAEPGGRLGALDDADESDELDDRGAPFFDPETDLSGGPSLTAVPLPDIGTAPREPLRRSQRRIISPRVEEDTAPASSGGRNLPIAVGVGVGLVAVGLICFKLGTIATTALVAVVLTLAAAEFFATVRRAGYNPATLLGSAAVAALAVAPVAQPDIAHAVVGSVAVIAGLLWFFWVSPGEGAVMNLGVTLLGIGWIGGLGSMASLTLGQGRQMADALGGNATNPGIGVIIAAALVTVSYDIGGFFVGRSLGRTPLSAASPNKTKEGLFGGVAAAIVVPLIIVGLIGIDPVGEELPKAVFFCLFCAIVAPLGDLCQSALKRDLGVKDMGTLLPGHGGVLDRFDAFLFVLPVAWFMAHLLELGPKALSF